MKKLLLGIAFLALTSHTSLADQKPAPDIKLYALNCGKIHVSNLNVFSDTDQYIGQEKTLTVGCYLIKHNDDWLLWDTGLSSDLVKEPEGITSDVFHMTLDKTIAQQIEPLGLKPKDITHVAISHGHFDHSANVNEFTNATLIIQDLEYNFIKNNPEEATEKYMFPKNIDYFLKEENLKQVEKIKGDNDIFNDGSIKAISLPGHTPGHMALLVNLPKAGSIILSGDQWHFTENHDNNGVPTFNFDRANTLASSDKLNRIIKNRGAKLIIQHEIGDNQALPQIPEAME